MEINSQTDSIASPFCHIQNANFRHLLKLITFTFHGNCRYHCLCYIFSFLGDVCITTGQNSPWDEFASATSCGSVFVYTMPPENVMPARVHRSRFLYCNENFMPEKKKTSASCKQRKATRFCMKRASRRTGTSSACARLCLQMY